MKPVRLPPRGELKNVAPRKSVSGDKELMDLSKLCMDSPKLTPKVEEALSIMEKKYASGVLDMLSKHSANTEVRRLAAKKRDAILTLQK